VSDTLILQTNHPGACLKMVFEHQTDRWSHRLVVASEETETTILRSREGDAEQPWPPSPPLQDASHHSLATGEAVLAVGMAGKSHWSASFSVDNGMFLADLACLFKIQPTQDTDSIGSQYEIGPDVTVTHSADGGTSLLVGKCRLDIWPVSESDWSTRSEYDNQKLILYPFELSKLPGQPTRWGYRFNLIDTG
jgi:hypothetical protein